MGETPVIKEELVPPVYQVRTIDGDPIQIIVKCGGFPKWEIDPKTGSRIDTNLQEKFVPVRLTKKPEIGTLVTAEIFPGETKYFIVTTPRSSVYHKIFPYSVYMQELLPPEAERYRKLKRLFTPLINLELEEKTRKELTKKITSE